MVNLIGWIASMIMRTARLAPALLLIGTFFLASTLTFSSPQAQTLATISLKSGNAAVGNVDPLIQFSFNNGLTWNPAFVVAPGLNGFPATGYHTIPGTDYVARAVTGANPAGVTTRYRIFFTLPTGYQFPALTTQVHADNQAKVYVNGTFIGGQAAQVAGSNFQNPPETYASANPAHFHAGQNTLEFYVYNYTNVSAADFKATVTYAKRLSPAGTVPCQNPTIVGTPGNDAIVATSGPNVIDGKGGNDQIVTGPFNDVICGGPGNDTIESNAGNDILIGGTGNDILAAGSGTDILLGQQGNDQLHGGPNTDVCFDAQGTNTFSGCP